MKYAHLPSWKCGEQAMRVTINSLLAPIILISLVLSGCGEKRVAIYSPPAQGAGSVDTTPLQPRSDVPGVGNFAKISDVLYRGEQPTAIGMAELKKMGIKTVVNLRMMHSDRDELKGSGLQYYHINCKAWHPEEQDVIEFLKIVSEPANQPVFVHCLHGADRTGMMIASYRIVEQGWTCEQAIAEIPNFGFHEIFSTIKSHLSCYDVPALKKKVEQATAPKVELVK
jgi:tyrosine-protein phosphatase SIW14